MCLPLYLALGINIATLCWCCLSVMFLEYDSRKRYNREISFSLFGKIVPG